MKNSIKKLKLNKLNTKQMNAVKGGQAIRVEVQETKNAAKK